MQYRTYRYVAPKLVSVFLIKNPTREQNAIFVIKDVINELAKTKYVV